MFESSGEVLLFCRLSFHSVTFLALSMGTLVKSKVTSKLTRTSSCIPAKCFEFRTWDLVFPARGEVTDAMYLKACMKGCLCMKLWA